MPRISSACGRIAQGRCKSLAEEHKQLLLYSNQQQSEWKGGYFGEGEEKLEI